MVADTLWHSLLNVQQGKKKYMKGKKKKKKKNIHITNCVVQSGVERVSIPGFIRTKFSISHDNL